MKSQTILNGDNKDNGETPCSHTGTAVCSDLEMHDDGTYTDKSTGEVLPVFYEMSDEAYNKEIAGLTEALIAKCKQHALPVLVVVQTANRTESNAIMRHGFMPGPRISPNMSLVYRVVQMANTPIISGMLGVLVTQLQGLMSKLSGNDDDDSRG